MAPKPFLDFCNKLAIINMNNVCKYQIAVYLCVTKQNNMKTLKIKKGSYNMTEEWIMKEYGSWEDHDMDFSHVAGILTRENATKSPFMFITESEAETILKSANYHCRAGWDDWDTPLDKARFEKCVKGYADRINKALSNG
jgi:hypothetical protein